MASKAFGSHAELGRWIMEQEPVKFEGRDPEEVGRTNLPILAKHGVSVVEDYSDIDLGEMWENRGDFQTTVGENLEGIGNMIATNTAFINPFAEGWSNPLSAGDPETGESPGLLRALGQLGVGGVAELGRSYSQVPEGSRAERLAETFKPENIRSPGGNLLNLLGQGLEYTGIADENNRAMARGMYDQWTESLRPHNVQTRPFNALANLADVSPVGPGKYVKAGKLGRALGAAIPSRMTSYQNVKDLAQGAGRSAVDRFRRSSGAGKVVSEGPTPAIKPGLVQRLSAPVRERMERLRVGDRSLKREVGSTIVGVTTSRPREWINQLLDRTRARGKEFKQSFRSSRSMKQADLASRIQSEALATMNVLNKIMGDSYEAATRRLFSKTEGPVLEMAPLQDLIAARLAEVNVEITKNGRLLFEGSDITPIGPARSLLRGELQDLLKVPSGKPPRMTTDVRTGSKIEIPAQPPAPNVMSAFEMHQRRKLIDDALSTLSPDSDVSAKARHALVGVREAIADHLENVPGAWGDEYRTAMREYRQMSVRAEELDINMRLRPGQVDKTGNIKGGTQEGLLRGMEGAIGDDLISAKRMEALEWLEETTGRKGLVDLQLAQMSQAWAAGGLIARHELAQLGRDIVKATGTGIAAGAGAGFVAGGPWGAGLGAAVGGIFAGLAGSVLFNPRAMSDALIGSVGKAGLLKDLSATQLASMQMRFAKIADAVNKMDAVTGGELRNMAIRESWNVSQMMERFEVQSEDGE